MKLFRDKNGEVGQIIYVARDQYVFVPVDVKLDGADSPKKLISDLGLIEIKTYAPGTFTEKL